MAEKRRCETTEDKRGEEKRREEKRRQEKRSEEGGCGGGGSYDTLGQRTNEQTKERTNECAAGSPNNKAGAKSTTRRDRPTYMHTQSSRAPSERGRGVGVGWSTCCTCPCRSTTTLTREQAPGRPTPTSGTPSTWPWPTRTRPGPVGGCQMLLPLLLPFGSAPARRWC